MKIRAEMTQKQMSEHFSVTGPAMIDLLRLKGLADYNGPTKTGHLLGGARYAEYETQFDTNRWAVWPVKRIESIFPQLAQNRNNPATTFKNRYVAMESIKEAGTLLSPLFPGGSLPEGLSWMISDPGRGGLEAASDKRSRMYWGERNIAPIHRKMIEQSVKLMGQRHIDCQRAIAILGGVLHWLSGKPQPKIDPGPPLPETKLQAYVDGEGSNEAEHRVKASAETIEILRSGYLFGDFRSASEDKAARDAILRPLDTQCPESFTKGDSADWAAFTRHDGRESLLRVHAGRDTETCQATAFPARMQGDAILIDRKPCMVAVLERGQISWEVTDWKGQHYLATRAAALLPSRGPIC